MTHQQPIAVQVIQKSTVKCMFPVVRLSTLSIQAFTLNIVRVGKPTFNSLSKTMSYFDPEAPDIVLKSLFAKYDTDNSGCLGKEELRQLFVEDLGLKEDQAQAYTLLLDKDGSASVSTDELVKWLRSGDRLCNATDSSRYSLVKSAVEMFNKYDSDRSQALSRDEFLKLHVELGGHPEHVDSALAALDKDGNGKISFSEFMKWLNWIPMDEF